MHRFSASILSLLVGLVATPNFAQSPSDDLKDRVVTVQHLSVPPAVATPKASSDKPAKTRLKLVSQSPNQITDDNLWFVHNKLQLPDYNVRPQPVESGSGALPDGCPTTFENAPIQRAVANTSPEMTFVMYGPDLTKPHYLVGVDKKTSTPMYALDFGNYRTPSTYTVQPIVFASQDDAGTLYVAHAINGYAKEARGETGYVTALDPLTGKLLWRSAPLVQNAATFADAGDVLVCGYGFTAEPDYVRLVDKKTGKIVQTVKVKTGPSYILRKGDRVYVRCYDTDYVFELTK